MMTFGFSSLEKIFLDTNMKMTLMNFYVYILFKHPRDSELYISPFSVVVLTASITTTSYREQPLLAKLQVRSLASSGEGKSMASDFVEVRSSRFHSFRFRKAVILFLFL
jgi:hypothetical protein